MENKSKLSLAERVRIFSVGTKILLYSKVINFLGEILNEEDFGIACAEKYQFEKIREQCFDAAYTGNGDYLKI